MTPFEHSLVINYRKDYISDSLMAGVKLADSLRSAGYTPELSIKAQASIIKEANIETSRRVTWFC